MGLEPGVQTEAPPFRKQFVLQRQFTPLLLYCWRDFHILSPLILSPFLGHSVFQPGACVRERRDTVASFRHPDTAATSLSPSVSSH